MVLKHILPEYEPSNQPLFENEKKYFKLFFFFIQHYLDLSPDASQVPTLTLLRSNPFPFNLMMTLPPACSKKTGIMFLPEPHTAFDPAS